MAEEFLPDLQEEVRDIMSLCQLHTTAAMQEEIDKETTITDTPQEAFA